MATSIKYAEAFFFFFYCSSPCWSLMQKFKEHIKTICILKLITRRAAHTRTHTHTHKVRSHRSICGQEKYIIYLITCHSVFKVSTGYNFKFSKALIGTSGVRMQNAYCSRKSVTKRCMSHHKVWPASWSSGQSLWLLIMRSRVRFPALPWEFSLKGKIPAVTMVWVD